MKPKVFTEPYVLTERNNLDLVQSNLMFDLHLIITINTLTAAHLCGLKYIELQKTMYSKGLKLFR